MTEFESLTRHRTRISEVEATLSIHDQIVWPLKELSLTLLIQLFHLALRIDPLDIARPPTAIIGHVEVAVRTERRTIRRTARTGKRALGTICSNRRNAAAFDFGHVESSIRRPHRPFRKLQTISQNLW